MSGFDVGSVESLAATKVAEVTLLRNEKLVGGFLHDSVLFDSDDVAIQNINSAVTLALVYSTNALAWNPAFVWITYDNRYYPLPDIASVIAFGQTAAAFRTTLFMVARQHKNTLEAMTFELNTVDDVVNYDITAGW